MSAPVATGLDRVAAGDAVALAGIRGKRVGLLAHPASVTRTLTHAHAVLEGAGAKVVALFGPEHGYGGEAQDMAPVGSDEGAPEKLRVYSLYGTTFDELRPTPEMLRGLDAVVVDLQDVGARYYTFVWSAALMLEAAAAVGVPTIVLDRQHRVAQIWLVSADVPMGQMRSTIAAIAAEKSGDGT